MHAFLLAVALAAVTGSGGKPAPKHIDIDIDDDEVVEGTTARGEGEDILANKRRHSQSLIRLREDFRREVINSFDSL